MLVTTGRGKQGHETTKKQKIKHTQRYRQRATMDNKWQTCYFQEFRTPLQV